MRRLSVLGVSALALAAISHRASAADLDLNALAAKPGAVTTTRTKADGSETREVQIGGVVFWEERQDDRVVVKAEDRSGHLAVMCGWMRYVEEAAMFDLCRAAHDETQIRQSLGEAVDRIDDFIVINSLTPITKEQLKDRAAEHAIQFKDQMTAMRPANVAQKCGPDEQWAALKSPQGPEIRTAAIAKIHHQVDDLLSLPRPPVSSPCL